MTTHTPGPWACIYTSNHAHDYRLTQPNGQPLPVNAPANDHSEQRKIARLIGLAPELFVALEHITRCASMRGPAGTTAYFISDEQMNAAKKLIEKVAL